MDEETFPAFRLPSDPYATALDDTLHVVYADDDSPFGTIALEGAAVTTTIDGPPPTGFDPSDSFAVGLRSVMDQGRDHPDLSVLGPGDKRVLFA